MSTIYTPDCPNGFKKVTLDDNKDVDKKIDELTQRIEEFVSLKDEQEVEKQLELMIQDGLIDENFAPTGFPKPFGGK